MAAQAGNGAARRGGPNDNDSNDNNVAPYTNGCIRQRPPLWYAMVVHPTWSCEDLECSADELQWPISQGGQKATVCEQQWQAMREEG